MGRLLRRGKFTRLPGSGGRPPAPHARLQAAQQRLLNQTLTAEALTKQYLEVLHDLRSSSNLVLMVPTEGGIPMLNIGDLRKNLEKLQ